MTSLYEWQIKHNISYPAMHELRDIFNLDPMEHTFTENVSLESAVQNAVRLEAAEKGIRLFRNNVGALFDNRGVPVRYGLANDTAALNAKLKSADLIGWRPVEVSPGKIIAQFVSRECKRPGWQYKATDRERAQLAWAKLINATGGDAQFCTGVGTL
jgi:hypothetical protein